MKAVAPNPRARTTNPIPSGEARVNFFLVPGVMESIGYPLVGRGDRRGGGSAEVVGNLVTDALNVLEELALDLGEGGLVGIDLHAGLGSLLAGLVFLPIQIRDLLGQLADLFGLAGGLLLQLVGLVGDGLDLGDPFFFDVGLETGFLLLQDVQVDRHGGGQNLHGNPLGHEGGVGGLEAGGFVQDPHGRTAVHGLAEVDEIHTGPMGLGFLEGRDQLLADASFHSRIGGREGGGDGSGGPGGIHWGGSQGYRGGTWMTDRMGGGSGGLRSEEKILQTHETVLCRWGTSPRC